MTPGLANRRYSVRPLWWRALLAICLAPNSGLFADEEPDAGEIRVPSATSVEFFESKIRPLFVQHCHVCHGLGRGHGGLNLESAQALRAGGESGPAVVPGNPDESRMLIAVRRLGELKMPPETPISDAEIEDLRKWIADGADWPPDAPSLSNPAEEASLAERARSFWSFQPIANPPIPTTRDRSWGRTSIDAFVLANLEAHDLSPAPDANRRALIRRATFDLIGLPPTPEEIEDFVADPSPDAFEKALDRLLASPRYGERWARYWLDVARYGEDQAHTFEARLYPNAYLYRDWVVDAFNDDLPYDRFIIDQIAGDLIPHDDPYRGGIAVGYFALGPVYYSDAGCAAKAALDELDDRVDTLSRGFLGLTIACARCHDHKFDPISQQDYYALAGVFASSKYREFPLVENEVVEKFELGQRQVKEADEKLKKSKDDALRKYREALAAKTVEAMRAVWKRRFPTPAAQDSNPPVGAANADMPLEPIVERWDRWLTSDAGIAHEEIAQWRELASRAASVSETERVKLATQADSAADRFQAKLRVCLTERQDIERRKSEVKLADAAGGQDSPKIEELPPEKTALLAAIFDGDGPLALSFEDSEKFLPEVDRKSLETLQADLETTRKSAPPAFPFAHSLTEGEIADMKLRIRGAPERSGDAVPRRAPTVLADGAGPFAQGSGRLELAHSIASDRNPLTARVIVNRVWQRHFGRGLVATPSNFGAMGELPTDPELLDHLAHALIESGWSIKSLQRRIMTSSVYMQASEFDERKHGLDPGNRLLWRFPKRRLDIEAWRDSLLAVAGNLDSGMGGPSGDLASPEFHRRTLYGRVSRHNLDPLLRLFDFPDPNITSANRAETTAPLQQLFVLNGDFMIAQSKVFAERTRAGQAMAENQLDRVRRAFLLAYGREASPEEILWSVEFLTNPTSNGEQAAAAPADSDANWVQFAQVLLSVNEFCYLD